MHVLSRSQSTAVCFPPRHWQISSNGAADSHKVEAFSHGPEAAAAAAEEQRTAVDGRRAGRDPDARSVSLLEQKRKVVSSSIDVPHAR